VDFSILAQLRVIETMAKGLIVFMRTAHGSGDSIWLVKKYCAISYFTASSSASTQVDGGLTISNAAVGIDRNSAAKPAERPGGGGSACPSYFLRGAVKGYRGRLCATFELPVHLSGDFPFAASKKNFLILLLAFSQSTLCSIQLIPKDSLSL
jgi:hypothetical protein